MKPENEKNIQYIAFILQDIASVAEMLWRKGWAERNSGNISVRITGGHEILEETLSWSKTVYPLKEAFPDLGGESIYLTGTGCRMRDVAKNPMQYGVVIRIESTGETFRRLIWKTGLIPKESNTKHDSGPFSGERAEISGVDPTSEITTHLMIQEFLKQSNSPKRAILHTHPTGLIALSHHPAYKKEGLLNSALWGMIPETLVFVPKGIGVVPYQMTGSRKLAEASVRSLAHHDVLLWEKHGCLAIGESVEEAFDLIDILSKSADIFLQCLSAGFPPEGLSEDQLNELRQVFHPF